jgi:preprotein translocase subunit SecG
VVPFLIGLLNVLLVVSSVFLICLVLIQRGKGGGLAGAFGGPGGSSAFGTKAGDLFTRITIITAAVWFALAMVQVLLVNRSGTNNSAFKAAPGMATDADLLPGDTDATKAAEKDLGKDAPALEPPTATDAATGEAPATDAKPATEPAAPAGGTPAPAGEPAK